MRVPWIEGASSGKKTKSLAELVDVYQTVCDVMGVDLPDDTVSSLHKPSSVVACDS